MWEDERPRITANLKEERTEKKMLKVRMFVLSIDPYYDVRQT